MGKDAGFSRRQVLLGSGAALWPFLPASVRAAEAPRRLLCVFHPMGYLENDFFPQRTSDTEFTLGQGVAPLVAFKNKLIFMDGLLLYGADWFFPDDDNEHASGSNMAFTGSLKKGYSTGPSIDGAVADALVRQGVRTPYKSLGLGVNAGAPSPHTGVFFSAAQQPINAQNNPKAVFDTIFKDVMGGGTPAVDLAAIARARKQKQSVIDLVRSDLNRICARVGASEKDKCSAHLEGIRDIENRLPKDVPPPAASVCTRPAPPAGGDLVATIHQQMDLITAAFTCDLTRVATLQLGFCDGGLDPFPGINQHSVTHAVGDTKGGPEPIATHRRFDQWYSQRFAYLLSKLDAVQEGNGTMLDNTLVLFGSDTTTAQTLWVGAHNMFRFPFFLAGGSNFAFKTGRALKYAMPAVHNKETTRQQTPHNRLLVSIGNAFGMNLTSFGTMDPGTGPLPML